MTSDTGNRTPGYRVRGDNVSHYTISDCLGAIVPVTCPSKPKGTPREMFTTDGRLYAPTTANGRRPTGLSTADTRRIADRFLEGSRGEASEDGQTLPIPSDPVQWLREEADMMRWIEEPESALSASIHPEL
ncbi:hypothetical protein FA13DRAFT_1715085 [Coprinellus micaceus]|uniref:Uncharacterized protein n=1 Tax=Coprinellus micaceus TaxID=71717 RepID=A0A4Y7SPQ1_COPMI|nr:hypothetical protein FA13DRAFT_1715085 [Coprinellus micaceus]